MYAFYVCVCVFIYVFMSMEAKHNVKCLHLSPSCFLRQGFSMDMEPIDTARLAVQ